MDPFFEVVPTVRYLKDQQNSKCVGKSIYTCTYPFSETFRDFRCSGPLIGVRRSVGRPRPTPHRAPTPRYLTVGIVSVAASRGIDSDGEQQPVVRSEQGQRAGRSGGSPARGQPRRRRRPQDERLRAPGPHAAAAEATVRRKARRLRSLRDRGQGGAPGYGRGHLERGILRGSVHHRLCGGATRVSVTGERPGLGASGGGQHGESGIVEAWWRGVGRDYPAVVPLRTGAARGSAASVAAELAQDVCVV